MIAIKFLDEKKKTPAQQREFPAVYERGVPVAIGILLFVIVIMLVFVILVITGVLGGAAL